MATTEQITNYARSISPDTWGVLFDNGIFIEKHRDDHLVVIEAIVKLAAGTDRDVLFAGATVDDYIDSYFLGERSISRMVPCAASVSVHKGTRTMSVRIHWLPSKGYKVTITVLSL